MEVLSGLVVVRRGDRRVVAPAFGVGGGAFDVGFDGLAPTDAPALNVTRSRLGRLTRQGFLTQPSRGRYQKRT